MNESNFLIHDLALILVLAGITTVIFKKIKQPLVLGYILAGFLASSNFGGLPNIINAENINLWAELGVVFLMFSLGLEFNLHKLVNIGGSAIVTATTIITGMVIIGYGVGLSLGWSNINSLFLGGMISMSSTMVILKTYEELNLKRKKYAQLVIGTLIIEDVAAIFLMIILSTIAVSINISGIVLVQQIVSMLLFLILWLVLGIFIIPTLLKKISQYMNDETLLIVSLAVCLGMVVIAEKIGFSSALGAFLAGSILAGTEKAENIEHLINPVKDLFGAVFFISVGLMVKPELLIKYLVPILIITIVTIVGQMILAFIGVILSGQSLKIAIGTSLSMVQIGEFSFIIATLGKKIGVTGDFLFPIVVSVSVITIFTTPILISQVDKLNVIVNRKVSRKTLKKIKNYTSDKQLDYEKDDDWNKYLSKYLPRTTLTAIFLFCIYIIGTKWFWQLFVKNDLTENIYKLVAISIVLLIMIPVINLMFYKKNHIFTKLWIKSKANRLPLLAFKGIRIFVSVFFVTITISTISGISPFILWLVSLIIVVISAKNSFMVSNSIKIETMFISNFNERLLAKNKIHKNIGAGYKWLDETLYVETIVLEKKYTDNLEKLFYSRNKFSTQIIKITRNEVQTNMPSVEISIEEQDIIVVMGKEDDLDAYIMSITESCKISKKGRRLMLRDYIYKQIFTTTDNQNHIICIAVEINKESPFLNKTILLSNISEKYKGFVIGIDRGNLSIINPNKMTSIELNDIVWILGSNITLNEFLRDEIIKG